MKSLLLIYFFFLPIILFSQDIILKGNITKDSLLTADHTYILDGTVRVVEPAVLTIEPGTIIYGSSIYGSLGTLGALIITPGAKIIAEGETEKPIIFTSEFNREGMERRPEVGDWGGLIILGNAPINVPGGKAPINGAGDQYGGSDSSDNSGVLRLVRIEYAGDPLIPNTIINAITFGGVGCGTIVEFIQTSFSKGDAFGWFGGTVNCKNLVSFNNLDDDFDFDFGYQGKLQFLLGIRDKDFVDNNGSNGIEADNDGSGSINEPRTSPAIFNATLIGPAEIAEAVIDQRFKRGIHQRRSSQMSVFNTLILGWPTGLLIDGKTTALDAINGNWDFKNSVIAGSLNRDLDTVRTDGSFNINNWFMNQENRLFPTNVEVKLVAPFDSLNPSFLPQSDSPVLTNAAIPPSDGFFDTNATYVGAFNEINWLEGWTRFDYRIFTGINNNDEVPEEFNLSQNFPNPFNPVTVISYQLPVNSQVELSVYNAIGQKITTLVNAEQPAGYYSVPFNAAGLSSGIYFYVINAGEFKSVKKLTLLK